MEHDVFCGVCESCKAQIPLWLIDNGVCVACYKRGHYNLTQNEEDFIMYQFKELGAVVPSREPTVVEAIMGEAQKDFK